MPKYGDKIRIKTIDQISRIYGISLSDIQDCSDRGRPLPRWNDVGINDNMIKAMGTEATFEEYVKARPSFIRLTNEHGSWIWHELSLESLPKFKIRRKVCQT